MVDYLVSIIMPVYNGELFIKEAIESVLDQDYNSWELLIVNDGSIDNTQSIIESFRDKRILSFRLSINKGVSAARNLALSRMKGKFYCFLDADDMLTKTGISTRLKVMNDNKELVFVDGAVEKWDENLNQMLDIWVPRFEGNPLSDLVSLSGNSFFGPSWMIRKQDDKLPRFNEEMSHGEDLLFYMMLSRNKANKYGHSSEPVLKYRVHKNSAMSNLKGIERGYQVIRSEIIGWDEISKSDIKRYDNRVKRILSLSYLRKGKLIKAIQHLK